MLDGAATRTGGVGDIASRFPARTARSHHGGIAMGGAKALARSTPNSGEAMVSHTQHQMKDRTGGGGGGGGAEVAVAHLQLHSRLQPLLPLGFA